MGNIALRPLVCFFLFTGLCLFSSTAAFARAEDDARRRAQEMLDTGRPATLLRGQEKLDAVRALARTFVNTRAIANFALAANRRLVQNPALMEEYQVAFEDFLVHWLTSRLSRDFGRADFYAIEPIMTGGDDGQVRVKLHPRNGNVFGFVILTDPDRNRNYRVVDLQFEGMSMALQYRSEYSSILAGRSRASGQVDMPFLINHIRGQTATLAQTIANER